MVIVYVWKKQNESSFALNKSKSKWLTNLIKTKKYDKWKSKKLSICEIDFWLSEPRQSDQTNDISLTF